MTKWLDDCPDAVGLYLAGGRLDEVECVISDLPGIARGKAMPATKFARQSRFFLPNSIFFQTITGDWGEAAGEEGFTEPDMILTPDLSTATAAPGLQTRRCRLFTTPRTRRVSRSRWPPETC